MPLNILVLGPQGSGKGTQAVRIAAEYEIPHVATGDIFRAAKQAGTELGNLAKGYMDRGELVPDEVTIDLIRERLGEGDTKRGFVLDGFPRNLAQAEALDRLLDSLGRQLMIEFEFQLDDATATERMLKRAEVEGRADDTPEVIARRLAIYHEETEPLVEYYRAQGRLVGIHADRTIDEVYAEIQAAIEQAKERAA